MDRVDEIACPVCRQPMVKRRNRTTGAEFYGCSQYPRCTGSREVREAEAWCIGDVDDNDVEDYDFGFGKY